MIALLVVGPEELPRVARRVAAFIGELRRQGEEVRAQVKEMIDDAISEEDMLSTIESIDKVRSTLSLQTDEDPGESGTHSSGDASNAEVTTDTSMSVDVPRGEGKPSAND